MVGAGLLDELEDLGCVCPRTGGSKLGVPEDGGVEVESVGLDVDEGKGMILSTSHKAGPPM